MLPERSAYPVRVAESSVTDDASPVLDLLSSGSTGGTSGVSESDITVIEHDAVLPSVEAVMVALPSDTAFTVPVEETVATEGLDVAQVISPKEAFEGETVAFSEIVSPTRSSAEGWLRDIPVTLTVEGSFLQPRSIVRKGSAMIRYRMMFFMGIFVLSDKVTSFWIISPKWL